MNQEEDKLQIRELLFRKNWVWRYFIDENCCNFMPFFLGRGWVSVVWK
jgi:hypothetical protein